MASRAESTIVSFVGPTLDIKDAAALCDSDFRPPAKRGDIYRAIRDGYKSILLIDGEFHGSPSVWQREIVDALREGVEVHGASSMGALRAAELHPFGMAGYGSIFEWYRDGIIDGDDEVALIYEFDGLKYRTLSEPLVNIRSTLRRVPPEMLSAEEQESVIAFAKSLYYPQRSLERLLSDGPIARFDRQRADILRRFITDHRCDQKLLDAIGALNALNLSSAPVSEPCALTASPHHQWERMIEEGSETEPVGRNLGELWRSVQAAAPGEPDLYRRLSMGCLIGIWARNRGIIASPGDFEAVRASISSNLELTGGRAKSLLAAKALVHAAIQQASFHGVPDPCQAIILGWAGEEGISAEGLTGSALVDWIIEEGPAYFGYAQHFEIELINEMRIRRGYGAAHR
jgi:hypothetical protein